MHFINLASCPPRKFERRFARMIMLKCRIVVGPYLGQACLETGIQETPFSIRDICSHAGLNAIPIRNGPASSTNILKLLKSFRNRHKFEVSSSQTAQPCTSIGSRARAGVCALAFENFQSQEEESARMEVSTSGNGSMESADPESRCDLLPVLSFLECWMELPFALFLYVEYLSGFLDGWLTSYHFILVCSVLTFLSSVYTLAASWDLLPALHLQR